MTSIKKTCTGDQAIDLTKPGERFVNHAYDVSLDGDIRDDSKRWGGALFAQFSFAATSLGLSRSTKITSAPELGSKRLTSKPMPLAAPVMRQVLPVKFHLQSIGYPQTKGLFIEVALFIICVYLANVKVTRADDI